MECTTNKTGYFITALIWNIATAALLLFLAAWPLDIIGGITENEILRGYAYGAGAIGTIFMFWFGLLSAILSSFIKCKKCNSRAMLFRYPFFVSLINCKCASCAKNNA